MTIPGGQVATAGITLVAVSPTHRRQGILSKLMKRLLEDARERGEPIAALWVAEETIYGRFGCGMTSINCEIRIDRAHTRFRKHWERLDARQVSKDEALDRFPLVYEQVVPRYPGMLARSRDWWEVRLLGDEEHDRMGAGPLLRVLFERSGNDVGYALYRHRTEFIEGRTNSTLEVKEAVGVGHCGDRVGLALPVRHRSDGADPRRVHTDRPSPLLPSRRAEAAAPARRGRPLAASG